MKSAKKENFINETRSGKWFEVKDKYIQYLLNVKSLIVDGKEQLNILWLSSQDTQSISFSEYGIDKWSFDDEDVLSLNDPFTYLIGEDIPDDNENIYNLEGELIESKLVEVILNTAKYLKKEEVLKAWADLKEKSLDDYKTLTVK
ncbi:hypothetical protein AAGG74_16980 [Bacillus mexicanus]|uniref:hypothetical protein n=1 Tax=Bacillus mexicanus TaxID=2834415 RepID=UPI003D1B41A7